MGIKVFIAKRGSNRLAVLWLSRSMTVAVGEVLWSFRKAKELGVGRALLLSCRGFLKPSKRPMVVGKGQHNPGSF